MFWKTPVAKRMSPALREILRTADITVGNLEGGVWARAKADFDRHAAAV